MASVGKREARTLRLETGAFRSLRVTRGETTWLYGNMFYGKRQMFSPEFVSWLENFRFPASRLETRGDQLELTIEGSWAETTMWEVPALAVIVIVE